MTTDGRASLLPCRPGLSTSLYFIVPYPMKTLFSSMDKTKQRIYFI